MSRNPSIAITAGLIGSGVLAWAFAGRPLLADQNLKVPLNPLGINHSPYGEVFAMAMQGPIDTNFHIGMFGATAHKHEPAPTNILIVKPEPEKTPNQESREIDLSLTDRLRSMLSAMEKGSVERTNPRPASEALKFYLRRQAEDKLRFAYQLDPSHYANYNSLHFFLVEGITTRPELKSTAGKLAEDTIQYCLKQKGDPRPALTAAAACTNMLHFMFADRRNEHPQFNTADMRHYLDILDECLARYDMIARQWDESKSWDRISPQRIEECEIRFGFIGKIRDAAEKTIVRFEGESQHQQAAN
jgi:hypothetical protein